MRPVALALVLLLLTGCSQPPAADPPGQSAPQETAATGTVAPPWGPKPLAEVHANVTPGWGGYHVMGTFVLTNRLDAPIAVLRRLPPRSCPYDQEPLVRVLDPATGLPPSLPTDSHISYDCLVTPVGDDDVVHLAPGESVRMGFSTPPYRFNGTELVAVTYDPSGPGTEGVTVPLWDIGPITAWAWVSGADLQVPGPRPTGDGTLPDRGVGEP